MLSDALPVRGFFAYPWHLRHEPMDTSLRRMQDTLCNAVALAASYHSVTALTPRSPTSWVGQRSEAVVSFQPNVDCYPPEGPWPLVDQETANADVLGQARRACDSHDMQLNLWLVVLHSSSLAHIHPDLCATNCRGDRYVHSLCPSQPRIRAYATGLVRDVCEQFRPHTLLLESATFMPALHGGHHEIALVGLRPLARWLLSLCFCPACVARARADGVDAELARRTTERLLTGLLNREAGPTLPAPDDGLSAVLLAYPALRQYAEMRMRAVMSLLTEIKATAAAYRVRSEVIPNTGVRPLSLSWTLGVSLRDLADAADGAMLLGYTPDTTEIEAEISSLRLLAGDIPFSVALNAGSALTPGAGALVAHALAATRAGARGLFYYNWSLLPEHRLAWVREANAAVLDASVNSVLPL